MSLGKANRTGQLIQRLNHSLFYMKIEKYFKVNTQKNKLNYFKIYRYIIKRINISEKLRVLSNQRQQGGYIPLPFLSTFLHPYFSLANIPLGASKTARFYLRNEGTNEQGKSAILCRAMLAHGAQSQQFCPIAPKTTISRRVTKLVRLLVRLPRAMALQWWFRKCYPRFARKPHVISLLIAITEYRRFFLRHPTINPFIISDTSPELRVIAAAANATGREVIWWQDDYHFFNVPDSEVTMACLLSSEAVRQFKSYAPHVKLFYQRQNLSRNIRTTIPSEPVIGIAVNALFTFNDMEMRTISAIKKIANSKKIIVRLHPTATIVPDNPLEDSIEIAPPDEAIEEFGNRVHVAIVGNSAIQLHLLLQGCPVVHIDGLDPLKFDYYGYCAEGMIFGAEDLASLEPPFTAVKKHYESANLTSSFLQYTSINPSETSGSLADLVKHFGT